MNRTEEYRALLSELSDLPPALDQTAERAEARLRRSRRTRRSVTAVLSSLAGAAAAFVLLVNYSLPFARACGKIPFLRELAQAVAFSPSLSAAVENEYVQPLDLTQTGGGVTMTVRYLIADERQIILFYTVSAEDPDLRLECHPSLRAADGEDLPAFGLSYSGADVGEADALCSITVILTENDPLPESFLLDAVIQAWPDPDHTFTGSVSVQAAPDDPEAEPQPMELATLTFPIQVDLSQIRTGRIYEIGQDVVLDGQTITVERLEVYPTFMQIILSDHADNTAWLNGLEFYLEDDQGRLYGTEGGITALGSADSPFWPIHRVSSSYFSNASRFTLYLTSARWLDKDTDRITLDLETGKTSPLPEAVCSLTAVRVGDGYEIDALFPAQSTMAPLSSLYWDSAGVQYDTGGYSQTASDPEQLTRQMLYVKNYSDTVISLGLTYSRFVEFARPIAVEIG